MGPACRKSGLYCEEQLEAFTSTDCYRDRHLNHACATWAKQVLLRAEVA